MTLILSDRDAASPALMGGKAAALAELGSSGLLIPPWFVISPEAFEKSLTDGQRTALQRRAETMPRRDPQLEPLPEYRARGKCAGVQELPLPTETDPAILQRIVTEIRMDPNIAGAIEQAARQLTPHGELLAVRSSAVDEDGADHSFAGQLESFLFVSAGEVAGRVAEVWRSGFTDRVFRYRSEHGMPPLPAPPAVLVQRMIDADVSGVAFAVDPITGNRRTVVVSAVFGLGTALVGGDADCDTYRLDHAGNVLAEKIARKTIRHMADPSSPQGVRAESVDDAQADRRAVDLGMLRKIVELVLSVSKLRRRPQDIEWAVQGGHLYLLQARPITALAGLADPDGARAIWDNSNIAESYSGITTPLTFSFARRAYDGAYRQFCRIMKVPPRVMVDNDAMFAQMLGLIRGRVYYNLLNWYRLLAMLPGYSVNQRFMEQMMGVREGIPADVAAVAKRTWSQRQSDRLRLAWSGAGLMWNHLVLPRKIRAFYTRLNEAMAAPNPPLAQMRLDQLAAEFRQLESRLVTRWDAPLINDFLAMIFFGSLGKLCKKWCPGASENLRNDLIGDEGGIISMEPARRISEMAKLAAADDALVDDLCNQNSAALEKTLAHQEALSRLYRAYLDKFGDRCLEELKLESSTLVDDPTPLLRSIGHAARRLREAAAPAEPFRPRQAAEAQVAQSLRKRPVRGILFRWVLHHARGRVRDRENLRFERTRLFGRVRRIFIEIGRRLCAEGRLENERDIFYLTLDEILGFVEGTSALENLRDLAALRRGQFDEYRAMPAPAERFETRGAVYLGNRFEGTTAVAPAAGTGQLQGTGCCPGIVRGPARVIRDPRQAQLKHGEILVAERTDPGWIMLFPAAAGILVERGSLLSHSAIVAREMGIPAVVSIPGLTAALADGQWVEMNGSSGTVHLISAPAATAPSAPDPATAQATPEQPAPAKPAAEQPSNHFTPDQTPAQGTSDPPTSAHPAEQTTTPPTSVTP